MAQARAGLMQMLGKPGEARAHITRYSRRTAEGPVWTLLGGVLWLLMARDGPEQILSLRRVPFKLPFPDLNSVLFQQCLTHILK